MSISETLDRLIKAEESILLKIESLLSDLEADLEWMENHCDLLWPQGCCLDVEASYVEEGAPCDKM